MNVIGIVCEYNPFHNGHKYQIDKIKEMYPDSILIACMSSSFTQRGDISIINKFDKTKIAIKYGIDIVIELPYIYTVQSADIFAKYSISLLNKLKIDTLIFGTETDDIKTIEEVANIQIKDNSFNPIVKKYIDEGYNYPTALNKALKDLKTCDIKEPNDLLAVSYIKEIISNKYNIKYKNIKRTNNYHDIESNNNIVSASNIRNSILLNKDISHQVPLEVYNILKNKKINMNKYFELLKYKIISEDSLSNYLEVNEGIDNRIKNVINKSNSLEELIQNIKSKRYTYNKISRILNHILCSIKKEDIIDNIEYIRILGFSNNGQKYLNKIKKELDIPILNSYNNKYKALMIEHKITQIYSLIQDNINDIERSNKPI